MSDEENIDLKEGILQKYIGNHYGSNPDHRALWFDYDCHKDVLTNYNGVSCDIWFINRKDIEKEIAQMDSEEEKATKQALKKLTDKHSFESWFVLKKYKFPIKEYLYLRSNIENMNNYLREDILDEQEQQCLEQLKEAMIWAEATLQINIQEPEIRYDEEKKMVIVPECYKEGEVMFYIPMSYIDSFTTNILFSIIQICNKMILQNQKNEEFIQKITDAWKIITSLTDKQ